MNDATSQKIRLVQPLLFQDYQNHPRIIHRSEHCVSRKDIDREALKVMYRLRDHGFMAYLVGGGVRDLLLGKRPKDFDIGTDARPEEIQRIFHHSRIIGKRFKLTHVYFKGGKVIEVSTFRKRSIEEEPGSDDDSIYGTPQEDAFRRDLTINGLFYNIADFTIIDYVGGMEDLKNRIIRAIGDPETKMLRDPVRMMRVIRHAARTDFTIEPNTWAAIQKFKYHIRLCSLPRVRDEWLKDLKTGVAHKWAALMLESGLFQALFPRYWELIANHMDVVVNLMNHLLAALGKHVSLETKGSQGNDGEAVSLAFFAYPCLHVMPEWQRLASERIRWPVHEVRQLLSEIFEPHELKKAIKDETAYILASLWPIGICAATQRWSKRLTNRANFGISLSLYNAVQEALYGQPVLLEQIAATPVPQKKARKRRKRRAPMQLAQSAAVDKNNEIEERQ